MLVICSGPETFQARSKYRELVAGYKMKYDKEAKSVERLFGENQFKEVMGKLGNQGLFASKSLVLCEGLLDGASPASLKNMQIMLEKDGGMTVVIDFEHKAVSDKTAKVFNEKTLLLYKYEELKGKALTDQIQALCKKHGVPVSVAAGLSQVYGSDLWGVDTALQILSVWDDKNLETAKHELNEFELTDALLKKDPYIYHEDVRDELDGVVPMAINKLHKFLLLQGGKEVQMHPYALQLLKNMKLGNPADEFLELTRILFARRNSIADEEEVGNLLTTNN